MLSEQKIRAFLFYLSVAIFFLGLPFILSFALGYKFNPHTLKFTKTGLIVLKTQPPGASIYLNKKLLGARTPATITELLPGRYHIDLELERHYPWFNEVDVGAATVTRLEKVILFPLRPNVKQVNKDRLTSFWIDDEREIIYFINAEEEGIYKSDSEGGHLEKITDFIVISPVPFKWKVSPDREKLLYFNARQIGIAYLEPQNKITQKAPFILNYENGRIADVFWHSDSYHLVLISNISVEALEAQPQAVSVKLVNLNKKDTSCFYDGHSDTLYFLDSQTAADGNIYDNLYKLELNARAVPLEDLIKVNSDE
ncbi:MAG: PEGA domain-containing protein [Candidatus Omnitrophica bacterium]|nr:PEGA domain-containing protein [Candidatus Omnitrophota bacterium]MDD5593056.1 PEGA domain-containing protein [Candidatus Omnitrophota bacterium]